MSKQKLRAEVLRVLPLKKRKANGKKAIVIVFKVEGKGEITRTYNLPKTFESRSTKLISDLESIGLKVESTINMTSPNLATAFLERELVGKETFVTIAPSGHPNFPYNIDRVFPISTINNE